MDGDCYRVFCYSPDGYCYVSYNRCTWGKVEELKKQFEPLGDRVEYQKL